MTTSTASQAPALLDIDYTVEDGISVTTTVKVAGTAVNWTGATITCKVRSGSASNGTVVAATGGAAGALVTVTGDSVGVLTITVDAATTTAIGAGAHPYSIRAVFPAGTPLTYVAGVLRGTLRAVHT